MGRLLIAGIGNVFFEDDGFGSEVLRALGSDLGPDVKAVDFGIRSLHLAYELLEPTEHLIVVDATSQGGTPGTLYLLEPELHESPCDAGSHEMNLSAVFDMVRTLGGHIPGVVILGCEPQSTRDGLGLTEPVAAAVPRAVALVRRLIAERAPTSVSNEETVP